MLELENLDLDLDEDFPADPFSTFDFRKDKNLHSNDGDEKKKENEDNSLHNLETENDKFTENLFTNKKCTSSAIDLLKNISENSKNNEEEKHVEFFDENIFKTTSFFNNSMKSLGFGENRNNLSERDVISTKRILTQRKFPGPAGLLPDKPLKELTDINLVMDDCFEKVSSEPTEDSLIFCSQSSSVFSEASYKRLIKDFDMHEQNCPLNKYTIDWVKKKAMKKILCGKKIPFIALVLHHVDLSTPDPVVKLKDSTGEIFGTLHREVWSEMGDKLHPGAALALRQVGVLITGVTRRQVYLNITANNIVTIYSYSDEEEIEKNVINSVTNADLKKSIDSWQYTNSKIEEDSSIQLFSTINKSKSNNFSMFSSGVHPNNRVSNCINSPVHAETINQKKNSKVNSSNFKTSVAEQKNSTSKQDSIVDFTHLENDFFNEISENFSFNEAIVNGKNVKDKLPEKNQSCSSLSYKEPKVGNKSKINRKRKIASSDDSYLKNKLNYKNCGESNHSKCSIIEFKDKEKTIVGSQNLSQADTLMVEEVLNGIDLDDFDL